MPGLPLNKEPSVESVDAALTHPAQNPLILDPDIVANLDNSIAVQSDKIKSGKFGILYETICNAPIAITAGALAYSGSAGDAAHTASGLLITIPIYAAMGASVAIPILNRRNLVTAKNAYENTGDAAYIDLVSAHLASTLTEDKVPHMRGSQRSAYQDSFNRNKPSFQKPTLGQRAVHVCKNLAALSQASTWRYGLSSGIKGASDIFQTIISDIKKLKSAPQNTLIMTSHLSVSAYKSLRLLSSAPPYNIAHIAAEEKELFMSGMRDLFNASGVQSLRQDISRGIAGLSSALTGDADSIHQYWDRLTKAEEKENIIGYVQTSENATLQVDKDHLDRTLHNIRVRNTQEKLLIGLNLVGISFETAFIKKYLMDTVDKGHETLSVLQTSWAHTQDIGMPALSGIKYTALSASGNMAQTAVAGLSGVLMGAAAWHHMVKTFNASNQKLNDATTLWAQTVEEQNTLRSSDSAESALDLSPNSQ